MFIIGWKHPKKHLFITPKTTKSDLAMPYLISFNK
jgi:hypothetical protein